METATKGPEVSKPEEVKAKSLCLEEAVVRERTERQTGGGKSGACGSDLEGGKTVAEPANQSVHCRQTLPTSDKTAQVTWMSDDDLLHKRAKNT